MRRPRCAAGIIKGVRTAVASRLDGFGTTIFTEMSLLAQAAGAINLGQGFPDVDGPAALMDAAREAMAAGANQYAPLAGVPALREAVAAHQTARYGLAVDPETEVQVCFGATEALTAAILGLVEPGDAVVVVEPAYDAYGAATALAGGELRAVPLTPAPELALDLEAVAAAAAGARLLVVNSPHNPTGRVLTRAELEALAAVCVEHDLLVLCDEVYEHLVLEGEHVPLATLPGMAERTLVVSSAGKTFSLTGWKVGWATGPAPLVAAVRAAKQFLSFAGGTPLQHAVAAGLRDVDALAAPLREDLRAQRDRLCAGLERVGLPVVVPAAGYFACADLAPLDVEDGWAWCRELPERAGVGAIPVGALCPATGAHRSLVRFAFCKRPEVLDDALGRLATAVR